MLKIPEFWLERRAATFGGTLRMYIRTLKAPESLPRRARTVLVKTNSCVRIIYKCPRLVGGVLYKTHIIKKYVSITTISIYTRAGQVTLE